MQNIASFVVTCFINKSSQKLFKFDYICIYILNKMSGQIWDQKSQTNYNLERREYLAWHEGKGGVVKKKPKRKLTVIQYQYLLRDEADIFLLPTFSTLLKNLVWFP